MGVNKEDKAGLYITIIFHLVVIIVMLAYQIDSSIRKEESFVLDFSKQEEIEQRKKEEVFKKDISKRIDEMLAAAQVSRADIKNIAVDASTPLKDDRNTDAEQLYKDAERLAKDLKNGQHAKEDAREETVELPSKEKKSEEKQKEYNKEIVVEIEPLRFYYAAEEYHQKYLDKNPTGYCHIGGCFFELEQ